MKNLVRLLMVIIAVMMAGYVYVIRMPQSSVEKRDGIALTADELWYAFENDEQAASEKYVNKIIDITGKVDEIYYDENNAAVLILLNDQGDPASMVTLDNSQKEKIKTYKEGDMIKVKALCTGKLMEVNLDRGLILE